MADSQLERAHLNLVDSSRQFFELDPNAAIEAEDGWLFGAGSATHPVISNAAFRRDGSVNAEDFIARAKEFFAARDRRFSIWIRAGQAADDDLVVAAEAAGFQAVFEMPEMLLGNELATEPLPPGAELRQLSAEGDAPGFWQVAKEAYASNGFPPEVFAGYTDHSGLLAENVVAFIVYLDGEPASIAMTIVSHGVAGIYWVGSTEWARGQGLGRAVTVAATNAGLALGAEIASLQASPMGRPIYTKLGYETAFDYRLLMSPPP
ncbi:MAG TPA: GNAT family N-acetyltransferase [Solirubrobacterales bacterium]|nr:GNAT family N-acetyltransferase [Solirubrobacterales bacterium]